LFKYLFRVMAYFNNVLMGGAHFTFGSPAFTSGFRLRHRRSS
jgi:hypothetical protein